MEEEQEIAEALFDLANLAAVAADDSLPEHKPPPPLAALRIKAEAPPRAAGAVEDAAAVASRLAAAAAAADAAGGGPMGMGAVVSPRKRQRKPNRNLVLYEEFAGGCRAYVGFVLWVGGCFTATWCYTRSLRLGAGRVVKVW